MTGSVRNAKPDDLTALWAATYGPGLEIITEDLVRTQIGHPLVRADALLQDAEEAVRAFAVLKAPASPSAFPGQDPERWHLSSLAFRTPEDGQEAVASVVSDARLLGAKTVVFGMDSDHLLPGCPVHSKSVKHVLTESGFQPGSEYFDLERDLRDYSVPERCSRALQEAGATIERCKFEGTDALDEFLTREFPGRWRHDTMRKVLEDGEPEDVVVLLRGRSVEGFAFTQTPSSVRPIGGAVWRRALGPDWAALGPIGVSRALRGRGLGDALLGLALDLLARQGARTTVIDWTTLDGFYGAHGFEISRRYRHMVWTPD